jgi:hypothetical protein
MEVIAEKSWDWMLFADGDRLLLSVVCGGVGVYEMEFELSDDEAQSYRQTGCEYLDRLAGVVRSAPTSFEARRLFGLLSVGPAKLAVAQWRQKQPR